MSRIAILYNAPADSRYSGLGEDIAADSVADVAEAVAEVLRPAGHTLQLVPLEPPASRAASILEALSIDVAFNLFEGFPGEPQSEPLVPLLLEHLGLPYTGNPPEALALALHKGRVNALLRGLGIATPQSLEITSLHQLRNWECFPTLVKPAAEDASHGITVESVVRDPVALERQVAKALAGYHAVLVEPFLEGREFNVGVLGHSDPQPLPPSEVAYTLPPGQPRLVTYGAKWRPEDPYYQHTNTVCPAPVEPALRDLLQSIACRGYLALGFRGYARFDLRLDDNGAPLLLDANPNPDLSPDAGLARQASAAGLSYQLLVTRILALALEPTT